MYCSGERGQLGVAKERGAVKGDFSKERARKRRDLRVTCFVNYIVQQVQLTAA